MYFHLSICFFYIHVSIHVFAVDWTFVVQQIPQQTPLFVLALIPSQFCIIFLTNCPLQLLKIHGFCSPKVAIAIVFDLCRPAFKPSKTYENSFKTLWENPNDSQLRHKIPLPCGASLVFLVSGPAAVAYALQRRPACAVATGWCFP